MELKTLKDFNDIGATTDDMNLDHENLKREAVKDIKAIHKDELVCDDVETYIKWKFNLTSEDLK